MGVVCSDCGEVCEEKYTPAGLCSDQWHAPHLHSCSTGSAAARSEGAHQSSDWSVASPCQHSDPGLKGGWGADFEWSSDNDYLCSSSKDKSVRVWDATSGACIRIVYGTLPVHGIRFHPVSITRAPT